jgi:hypothetical protein
MHGHEFLEFEYSNGAFMTRWELDDWDDSAWLGLGLGL